MFFSIKLILFLPIPFKYLKSIFLKMKKETTKPSKHSQQSESQSKPEPQPNPNDSTNFYQETESSDKKSDFIDSSPKTCFRGSVKFSNNCD